MWIAMPCGVIFAGQERWVDGAMATTGHTDFWVVIGTVAPIAIATNVITFGQAVTHRAAADRAGEQTVTSWLRSKHLYFVMLNLGGCLYLLFVALQSLYWGHDVVNGWFAIGLLFALILELFVLAVCAEALIQRAKRLERADRPRSTRRSPTRVV
jgi:hypothetical protein